MLTGKARSNLSVENLEAAGLGRLRPYSQFLERPARSKNSSFL